MPIEVQTNLNLEAHPVDPSHVVNIEWVVNYVSGKIKAPVRVVATANQSGTYTAAPALTFEYTATGPTVIDGVTLAANDRVLLAGQTSAQQNGVYTVTTVGAGATHTILTRAADFRQGNVNSGVTIAVNAGDDHGHSFWKLTSDDPITIDTTALNFLNVKPPAGGVVKFSEEITGDGTKTHFDIDHDLGTEDVTVQIWNNATQGMVLCDVKVVDDDSIEVGFDVAPTAAQVYRVVVLG